MNRLRRSLLGGLVAGLSLSGLPAGAAAVQDSPAAERFKQFLSTPPIVESVVFEKWEPLGQGNPSHPDRPLDLPGTLKYYEGRWQGEAFLLRELPGPDAVLKTTGLLAASDGVTSWFHFGKGVRDQIVESGSGASNAIVRSAYLTSHDLRQLLMLGIMRSTPGSVEWPPLPHQWPVRSVPDFGSHALV